ncbi:indolepyruvate ferredoxin oxidoreductase family protein [Pseudorhodoferax sp. Leaf274]|uniref:indolepyruvate ferredoxin oxidoreductase family protein n=1 Tax=Pseudorhodoferax sp. Leaf274 TaxID=1736318 RepID=UPI000702AA1D|nr:indolepyruvate ferredoxin oxidoreductase family protein [Pseudorhodoferax sp. Leaf274]KQP45508.1 indolepyruvate ferredoxin oxidoreductase [Pseudorhodoferax sp. Leaf274]
MGADDRLFEKQDIYGADDGPAFMSGIQALVRLPMVQRRLDRSRGLATAGLVSGYRGSPLGAYDQQLWKAAAQLKAHDIVFQPGLNEDLAATALWGAQMHRAFGPGKVDGVFGIWYGKGPGVDRTGDVFRSANVMGTSPLGGVLAVSGDDHAAQSSMYPHQTDGLFQAVSMPVLQPASVGEVLELGLAGIALSRFSGLWVGMKTIAEVVEAAGVVQLAPPTPFVVPQHDGDTTPLNWDPAIQWPAQRFELERRLIDARLPAARRWARANQLDKTIVAARERRLGVVTVGKAHQDLMQACADLGLTAADLQGLGVSVYKVAMSWPLETTGIVEFAKGHQELFVVEEKRATVESQIKEALYHAPSHSRPAVTGKQDPAGRALLPETSEFTPIMVARALVERLGGVADLPQRLARMQARQTPVDDMAVPARTPYFCSGCPHNTSTRTPDGSISGGGIGCHVMALMLPELKTDTFCQMGGEGVQWAGAQPFSETRHIFQNLGDGTYQHSGVLAIRAALALGTNITYKILYNDAVAMTGGQQAEGTNDPARITRQLHAEGVTTIALVSDVPENWEGNTELAPGVTVHHRDALDAVQRRLREIEGVTAIVYVQTCAAEKRRRRKKDKALAAPARALINSRVCEGCGDCSVQSNCIAIEPLETPFGRKRTINQSSCNTDMSCIKGFCPSFVEIEGGKPAKPGILSAEREQQLVASLAPVVPSPMQHRSYNVLFAGIGGSGVLTVGALLGAAALVDRKVSNVLDFTGLAQKNGAVLSQVRISTDAAGIQASRIGPGAADLLIGADLVYSASDDVASRLSPLRSAAVVNADLTPTAAVVRNRDAALPAEQIARRVEGRCAPDACHSINASALTTALFGDSTSAHVLMLGYAWQKGLLPLSIASLEIAIDSAVAPATNRRAFSWGRIAAQFPQAAQELIEATVPTQGAAQTLDQLVQMHALELTRYQNAAYAKRYLQLVNRVRNAERDAAPGTQELARAVAVNAYRVMAYKDEYEVARLYASADFKATVHKQFDGVGKVSVWLAPPGIARIDANTGRPRKIKFGPWIFKAFAVLAAFKGLRGGMFDPFGRNHERVAERELVADYFDLVDGLVKELKPRTHASAVELANLVSQVRGFGPVKLQALQAYRHDKEALLQEFRAPARIAIAKAA